MKKLIQLSIVLALLSVGLASAYYSDFYNIYMNQQLGPIYGYQPMYGFSYSPYYDSSSNWQRGWTPNGGGYAPGLTYTRDGTQAATYHPQYGSARYNPYADDNNFAGYQQTRDSTRQYLQANEQYDDLNYPSKQLSYLDFFERTDPRNYNMPFGYLYPYGKKPYFKKYGDNPGALGYLTEGPNPFWGTTYARNFHCHGPNFGCHVHNVFEDSA
ncbi:MAG: hypothetical protein AABX70_07615 [Nanoarchaeota archaeon]